MKNVYIKSLFTLMLISASVHMVILFIYAVVKGEIIHLNYFNILDLDLVAPSIIEGPMSQILAFGSAGALYLVILVILTKRG